MSSYRALALRDGDFDGGTYRAAIDQPETDRQGPLVGLTVQGFSQLLEVEQKTCRLLIDGAARHGELVFDRGVLIDAATDAARGNDAALDILSWSDTRLEVIDDCSKAQATVTLSLRELLLEAARLDDVRNLAASSRATGRHRRDEAAAQPPELAVVGGTSTAPQRRRRGKAKRRGKEHGDGAEPIRRVLGIEGAVAALLFDLGSGRCLAGGGTGIDLEVVLAGGIALVRAEVAALDSLDLDQPIEDILVTISRQYHLIRRLSESPQIFLYLVLDRAHCNLGLARHALSELERELTV